MKLFIKIQPPSSDSYYLGQYEMTDAKTMIIQNKDVEKMNATSRHPDNIRWRIQMVLIDGKCFPISYNLFSM